MKERLVVLAHGMASFAPVIDADEAEAIRAYVITQANAALGAERTTSEAPPQTDEHVAPPR